jgi:hypothetical protein
MAGLFQLAQGLQTSAQLLLTTDVMKSKPFTYHLRQLVSVENFVALKQFANIFNVCAL